MIKIGCDGGSAAADGGSQNSRQYRDYGSSETYPVNHCISLSFYESAAECSFQSLCWDQLLIANNPKHDLVQRNLIFYSF
jgi:hypothetical protein